MELPHNFEFPSPPPMTGFFFPQSCL